MEDIIFVCKNGEEIRISPDHDLMKIYAYKTNGDVIGRFEFDWCDSGCLLTWAFLDLNEKKYTNQGIGEKIIDIACNIFDGPIYARYPDGQQHDDGSHLTGNAPGFVNKLISKGKMRFLGDQG